MRDEFAPCFCFSTTKKSDTCQFPLNRIAHLQDHDIVGLCQKFEGGHTVGGVQIAEHDDQRLAFQTAAEFTDPFR